MTYHTLVESKVVLELAAASELKYHIPTMLKIMNICRVSMRVFLPAIESRPMPIRVETKFAKLMIAVP